MHKCVLSSDEALSPCSGITQCSGALIGVQRQHVLTTGQCVLNSSTSQVQLQRLEVAEASGYGCSEYQGLQLQPALQLGLFALAALSRPCD